MVITLDNAPWLTLTLVAAAWALVRALTGGTRWLLLSAALLGCRFLVKMGQTLTVVPAFVLAYVVGSTAPLARRWLDVGPAAVVLAVTSLWWVVLMDLWLGTKPYVGAVPSSWRTASRTATYAWWPWAASPPTVDQLADWVEDWAHDHFPEAATELFDCAR